MLTALNQGAIAWAVAALLLALAGMAVAWRVGRKAHAGPAAVRDAAPAERDLLTGLPTRVQFETALQGGLAAAEKSGADSCVLYIGVDGFRLVHDSHGSALADKVLAEIAGRLRTQCGGSTPMCRVAGDEFAIWLNAPRDAGEKLAHQLTEDFARTFSVEGREISIGLSVGLAIAPEHGTSMRLVGKAAAAMRSVKLSGGSGHAVFDPRIEAEQGEEATIARELQQAILKKQLELFYQPRIDADHLQVTAVEALLRWRHPALGLVSPARFIPIAERYGLIDSIGTWVLESALKQAAAWRGSGLRLRVAVNISGFQFRQDNFAAKLERGLKAHGLPPEAMTCEISELVAVEDTEATRKAFMKLEKLGVHVSIDNFSAGPPGLAAVQRLHAHELKIDRAAIAAIGRSTDARAVVECAVKVAHAHKMRVVAEGVETEAQRDQAVRLGCDELQGYLIARPLSARALALWAVDAPANLAQTVRASSFADTQPYVSVPAPQAFAETRISLRR